MEVWGEGEDQSDGGLSRWGEVDGLSSVGFVGRSSKTEDEDECGGGKRTGLGREGWRTEESEREE